MNLGGSADESQQINRRSNDEKHKPFFFFLEHRLTSQRGVWCSHTSSRQPLGHTDLGKNIVLSTADTLSLHTHCTVLHDPQLQTLLTVARALYSLHTSVGLMKISSLRIRQSEGTWLTAVYWQQREHYDTASLTVGRRALRCRASSSLAARARASIKSSCSCWLILHVKGERRRKKRWLVNHSIK